ncbi:MAG TPA: cupin domain-containing protein [Candidatus Binatia bacterium]
MATGYSKMVLPFNQVKEKEFLSRPMGCKGVGFSFVRYKPGEGATYVHRHKVQEEVFITLKGTGSIILDGKRISMPEGTIVRVAPRVYRALGNDSNKDVIYMILGAIPPTNFRWVAERFFGTGFPTARRFRAGKNSRWGPRAKKCDDGLSMLFDENIPVPSD